MRWPIRNQILLPLVMIQLLVVICVTGLGTWFSLRRVERDVQQRFQELTGTIQRSTFPLTAAVLEQLHGLSGAHFVLLDSDGGIQATTLNTADAEHVRRAIASGQMTQLPQKKLRESPESLLVRGEADSEMAVPLRLPDLPYRAVRVPALRQESPAEVVVLYPDAIVQSARGDAVFTPMMLGLLTLVLTTIAGMLVAQHIGRRIQAIERQVAYIAQGNFEQIPLDGKQDELRDLAASVNQMSGQLEQMAGHIRATERAQLLKQVAGGIAHQLRNSLTGARLAMQLHRRRCERADDESLDVALRQLALTEEQIRGLVALIRDEHRTRVTGKLSAIVREVASLVNPMCEHRQIRFQVTGAAGDIWLKDSDQIRAALLNLCINSIEATTTGGLVEVRLFVDGSHVRIEVCDDGPGVSEQVVNGIFDPFHTTKPEGMGLGLALVRQTAEDHAGHVEYVRQNGQTVFRFTCQGSSISET